jgi:two-component system, OmpR family, response regulator VicR
VVNLSKEDYVMSENTVDLTKVVYIEDDPEMIELVSLILKSRGLDVIGAHGGRKGLETAKQEIPDLILLDLMMPDMDGWEVFQQLRADSSTAAIPVIIITAKSQTIDQVLGLHIAHVNDYICKPFRPQELIESIGKVLGKEFPAIHES